MTHKEKIDQVCNELDSYIKRMALEYDLTIADMVGVLEVRKHMLISDKLEENEKGE